MKYVALLRGINVNGRKVDMKTLAELFVSLGFSEVKTYINSGNVIFESGGKPELVKSKIESAIRKEFGFEVPTLVKSFSEMKRIARAVPKEWANDSKQRTDIAYLFKEVDSKRIVDELPFKKEYVDVRYVKGALFWNIDRRNYNKSQLNKIIGHKSYKFMTLRNVNTARFLANI
jgi:uncharacterized protein (DUF1697 family)